MIFAGEVQQQVQQAGLTDYLALFAQFSGVMIAATAGVWGATEILGRQIPRVPNIAFALVLGPLTGWLAWGAGWLPTPGAGHTYFSGAFAALMGLTCTFAAKAVNDKINPLRKARPGTVPKGGGLPG